MNKKILTLLGALVLLSQTCGFVWAKTTQLTSSEKLAIKKYKAGNYTGCLQDCQSIVKRHPSAVAYYYIAISYVQAGKKDEAIKNYEKAIAAHPSAKIAEYANLGKMCLESPDKCKPDEASQQDSEELDKFIKRQNAVSDSVKKDFEKRKLNNLKNDINKEKDLDEYIFRNFKDYSKQKTMVDETSKIAQKPSEEEIKNAIKILNDAGINYEQNPMIQSNNAELNQLQAVFNSGNGQGTDMIPAVFMQNKNGDKNNYSAEMMQALMMSSMMKNLNYNLDTTEQ